jgi:hypothetical protein
VHKILSGNFPPEKLHLQVGVFSCDSAVVFDETSIYGFQGQLDCALKWNWVSLPKEGAPEGGTVKDVGEGSEQRPLRRVNI